MQPILLASAIIAAPFDSLPLDKKEIHGVSETYDGHSSSVAVLPSGKIVIVSNGKPISEQVAKIVWIVTSQDGGRTFSKPEAIFSPKSGKNCSSPVLKVLPPSEEAPYGELVLFTREGPSYDNLTSWQKRAKIGQNDEINWENDGGELLPEGYTGPTKTPPLLYKDFMLVGSSGEKESITNPEWTTWVKIETADARGKKWLESHTFTVPGRKNGRGGLEPTFILNNEGLPAILCRDRVKESALMAVASLSESGELVWPKELSITSVPNPDSGLASLYLSKHRINVIAFNNSNKDRASLSLAISYDGGKTWGGKCATLAPKGEFPALALFNENGEEFILSTYAAKVDEVFKIHFSKVPVDSLIQSLEGYSNQ